MVEEINITGEMLQDILKEHFNRDLKVVGYEIDANPKPIHKLNEFILILEE